ncbi:MAG: hypothetical protein H0U31_03385, partial [Chloroflexia bacterium]|nr:hypothetical protein [Chloroflexia bacterium]
MVGSMKPGKNRETGQVGGAQNPGERAVQIIAVVVLVSVALAMFIPFAFSIATSLKTSPEAAQLSFGNMFWPQDPTDAAYQTAFDSNIARWFFNSVLVALIW